jgi:hypothetical protein
MSLVQSLTTAGEGYAVGGKAPAQGSVTKTVLFGEVGWAAAGHCGQHLPASHSFASLHQGMVGWAPPHQRSLHPVSSPPKMTCLLLRGGQVREFFFIEIGLMLS